MKKKVSLIIPIYNEQDNIPVLYQQLVIIMDQLQEQYVWECIFVNDGSTDSSWDCIARLHAQDDRIRALSFSRNFGHQMALSAGYEHAQGDVLITLDADLQDPPALIPELLAAWRKGYPIVYARRSDRNDGWLKDTFARVYYMILHMVAEVTIPRNVGDFRLIERKVLQAIVTTQESTRYWRGLVAWTGFKHTCVDFKRPERIHGQPGYTWKKSLKLGFDGLTGFSFFPLELAAYVGVFVIATGILMFTYIAYDALMHDVCYPLFKWLTTIIYIFTGVQFILTWLVGEYIGRMYMQQKQRPLYIVDEVIGEVTNESYARAREFVVGDNISLPNRTHASAKNIR